MRITAKGQLTIPQSVRVRAGLMPGTDVDVVLEDGVVQIRRAGRRKPDAIDKRVAAFAGTATRKFTTEELMSLFRDDD